MTNKASEEGKKRIKSARELRGWSIEDPRWLLAASEVLEPNNPWTEEGPFANGAALATWRRFIQGKAVRTFNAFCEVLGLNPEEIKSSDETQETDGLFYIARTTAEREAHEEITSSEGGLVRIKAPEKFGKTWFLNNLIDQVIELDYQSLIYDFHLTDSQVFSNLDRFFKSFCAGVSLELSLPNAVNEYWDEMLSSNYNVTNYFEKYLLQKITHPLVLVMKRVDKVFEHTTVAHDFCELLRLFWV